ncbi:MAG: class I SAM-dependent rRNA methyltransferase [Bacteroidota bacterium]
MANFLKVNRLPITLTADAERQVRAGHPWIFDQSIAQVKGVGQPGDLGMVFDRKKNKLMAIGLYDPDSPIRLRIIHRGGSKIIDKAFWSEQLEAALQTRKAARHPMHLLPERLFGKSSSDVLASPSSKTSASSGPKPAEGSSEVSADGPQRPPMSFERTQGASPQRPPMTIGKAKRFSNEASEDLGRLEVSGWRVIHGESDGFPGLVVDHYAGTLVVKVYSPIWLPWFKMVMELLMEKFEQPTVVMRLSRQLQKRADLPTHWVDGRVLHGQLVDEQVTFSEYGLQFKANLIKGHKTGFFLDHRHNRKRVGELAGGKRVLDLFSYVGGFSLHALGGGARQVTSVDISAQAQAQVARHIELNSLDTSKHEAMVGDVFELLQTLKENNRLFDLIVSDPPSFAKRADERERAMKAYRRLAKLVIPLVSPGGIYLAASCSARITADEFFEVQKQVLQKSGRKFEELERTFHDFDHPIGFKEGAYLKSIYYRLS